MSIPTILIRVSDGWLYSVESDTVIKLITVDDEGGNIETEEIPAVDIEIALQEMLKEIEEASG